VFPPAVNKGLPSRSKTLGPLLRHVFVNPSISECTSTSSDISKVVSSIYEHTTVLDAEQVLFSANRTIVSNFLFVTK
jgi:hypothetical protein